MILSSSVKTFAAVGGDTDNDVVTCTYVVEDITPSTGIVTYATTKSKTARGTAYFRNSSGETMWYLTLTATFTYNGTTSKCTSSSASATSCNKYWQVTVDSCSHSGNKATAKGTGKQIINSKQLQTITRSISLSCAKDGTIS